MPYLIQLDSGRSSEKVNPGRILLTGAAGRIGRHLAAGLSGEYTLRLTDRDAHALDDLRGHGEVVAVDLAGPEELDDLFKDIDTVLHFAGEPSPVAAWDRLLDGNIEATRRVLLGAAAGGCRRLVLASSVHAVSGYPPERQISESDPVNPGDLYGVTKCFGEALGRYVAEQFGISVLALRIGAASGASPDEWTAGIDLHPDDLLQLVRLCIQAEDRLRFGIFNAVSDNEVKQLDITAAREVLGFQPQYRSPWQPPS